MKRAIYIEGSDKELVISSAINPDITNAVIYFDELPDGTYRLAYSKALGCDFSQIQSFDFGDMSAIRSKTQGSVPLTLVGTDKVLEVYSFNAINMPLKMIYLAQQHDGGWKMFYSKSLIPDLSLLKRFVVIRED